MDVVPNAACLQPKAITPSLTLLVIRRGGSSHSGRASSGEESDGVNDKVSDEVTGPARSRVGESCWENEIHGLGSALRSP